MKSKKDLIAALNLLEQERGNLTVLFTNTISQQIGLSATEFECLDTIGNNQPITAGQLAALTGLSTGGVTGVIDRLEKAGYVVRKRDTADRRKVLLEQVYDEDIVKKVRALYAPLATKFDALCEHYSAADLAIIIGFEQRTIALVHELLGHSQPTKNELPQGQ